MIRFASIKLWQAVSIDFLKLFISKISQLNIALHCEYCLHWHSKLSIYFNIVLLSNSNFDRVYLSIKKRRGCHGDAKRWHLHIYIAKRRNVIIYSCHLAVFVKGSVLTRSNSLVSHLRPKWAALKCVFCADEGLNRMKLSWYGKSSLEQRTRPVDFHVDLVCTEKVFIYVAFCLGTNTVRAHFFCFILSLFTANEVCISERNNNLINSFSFCWLSTA